ncbi:MAG: Methyltransferase type 11 [Myxococcaceae bacterium]|nr:Methyltransferase type 11 [Myxococcaceae bacterium]
MTTPDDHEGFKPLPHAGPQGPAARVRFAARLMLDLQVRTVHRDMRKFLPGLSGKVLDVGCGQSPYRHMLGPGAQYVGIDFEGSSHFEYERESDVTYFDGKHIPLDDGSVDHLLCTEVLEHLTEPKVLVREMHRVLKKGGTGVVTVPWSARYHYIPYDYFRYTPSMLAMLFEDFARARIEPRGTDVSAITSKIIVLAFRPLLGGRRSPAALFGTALLAPLALVAASVGQAALALELGSPDDPLGYTVWLEK